MRAGLLFDQTKCIGCGACSAACKEQNDLPMPIEAAPTAYTWTVVEKRGDAWIRRLCFHCLEPTCASVCPVGALYKSAEGPVAYDSSKCIGCRYCIMACPFGVPKYQWDRVVPIVGKCVMCVDRVRQGLPTACAAVCPTGATLFGDRDALVREAQSRLEKEPDRYVQHVYGLTEAGGTSVLMIAGVPFDTLGMKTDVPQESLPMLTWQVMEKIPAFVSVWGLTLFGVHWITRRRDEVRLHDEAGTHDSGGGEGEAP